MLYIYIYIYINDACYVVCGCAYSCSCGCCVACCPSCINYYDHPPTTGYICGGLFFYSPLHPSTMLGLFLYFYVQSLFVAGLVIVIVIII